jgi:hypothetical protein
MRVDNNVTRAGRSRLSNTRDIGRGRFPVDGACRRRLSVRGAG